MRSTTRYSEQWKNRQDRLVQSTCHALRKVRCIHRQKNLSTYSSHSETNTSCRSTAEAAAFDSRVEKEGCVREGMPAGWKAEVDDFGSTPEEQNTTRAFHEP